MHLTNFLPICLLGGLLACQKPADTINPDGPSAQVDSSSATPTAVGQPIGAPVTKVIGPAGGTVTTLDGKIALIFPAGTVKQETALTVQPSENKAPNGVGEAFTISPNLRIEQGITVIYYYQDEEMNGASVDALGIAYQTSHQGWLQTKVVTVDKAKKTITTQIKEEGCWAIFATYYLDPKQAAVGVSESLEINLLKAGKSELTGDLIAPLVVENANKDVTKRYINGVDWTSSTPKNQSWGAVGYNPQTGQMLYIAPGAKPKNNPIIVSVEVKNPMKAQLLLSSQITVQSENSLLIDGHSFDNFSVSGARTGDQYQFVASGTDSTGKAGSISLFLNSLSIGSHPFTKITDDKQGTFIDVVNQAGKGDSITGASFYSTCEQAETESGAIQVVKVEPTATGYRKVKLQVSGQVVTVHEINTKCQVITHKTMSVHGAMTVLIRD